MSEPPIARLGSVVIIVLAVTLAPVSASADTETRVFYYGVSDGYLGKRHAASFWNQTPDDWPEVVDLVHYGVATSDWSIPFGTKLCLTVTAFPDWSEGEYNDLLYNTVCDVIVVDRMAAWVEPCLGPSLDAWPALFHRLVGEDWERIGTVKVRVTQVGVAQVRVDSRGRRKKWRN